MRMGFYPRLAWDGIRKNRRLYTPYLLTCGGVVMMFYLIHYLAALPALNKMAGGRTTAMMLGFGTWIVALFALIFLTYTNSFLMRRRKKEFGLYNILGMSKGNLSRVLLWETGLTCALSLAAGLCGGVLLSKLAELGLLRALGGGTTYAFTVSADALKDTLLIFLPIFAVIYLCNLWQLRRMSAVSLMKSESAGEKPPRANVLLGAAGLVILAAAYDIAISIKSPLAAMAWFFIAVVLVIVATYLLFIAGSVMLCRLLQRNRRYYYRKEHFTFVSSMAFRMKRNGAGLASICILSTMVLVMMLGAGSLYFGTEDSLHARYPRQLGVYTDYLSDQEGRAYTEEKVQHIVDTVQGILDANGVTTENEERYLSATATGLLRGGVLTLDYQQVNDADLSAMDALRDVAFIPLADYNRVMGTNETIAEDEALLCCVNCAFDGDAITMRNGTVFRIKKQVADIMGSQVAVTNVIPALFLVVPDLSRPMAGIVYELQNLEDECRVSFTWHFDTDLDAAGQVALGEVIRARLRELDITGEGGFYSCSVECRETQRSDFYGTFAGIFFLGALLSVVFLAATVLIIYYKQITEGYEDESRFAIMRKVGMTREDIRRSVNAQMRTVFFLPLVTAALHLAFAFPMVKRLVALFNLNNLPLMLAVMGVTVLVFAVFYAAVYRLTSHVYFTIVSGREEA